jgi:hypothetical protein
MHGGANQQPGGAHHLLGTCQPQAQLQTALAGWGGTLEELHDVQATAKLNLQRDIMLPLDVLSKKFQHMSYLLPHHVRKATQQVAVELQTDFIEAELLSGQHYDNFKVSKRHMRVRVVS